MENNELIYGLPPFIPPKAKVLVLGSMPSVASLKEGFYYMHKQNRFFKIIEILCGYKLDTIELRKKALNELNIALYDVIEACEREGSLDAKIKHIVPSDIKNLLNYHQSIKRVITNGALSKKLFLKYSSGVNIEVVHLPSTSPANAVFNLDRLSSLYIKALKEF